MRTLFSIIVAIILLTGCEITKPTETIREYYRKDSIIPGATVRDSFPFIVAGKGKDSLIIRNHWYTKLDTNGRAELRYMIDQHGQLIMECQAKDATIEKLVERITKVDGDREPKPKRKANVSKFLDNLAILLLAGLFIGLITYRIFFNK